MSEVIDDFIKRASLRSVGDAVAKLDLKLPRIVDAGMPCPRIGCGGKDRFAVNVAKGVWNCRRCGGGKTGLGLVGHVHSLDLHDRDDLLDACATILGESIPEEAVNDTPERRAVRKKRMDDALAKAERDAQDKLEKQNAFRERDIRKGRGIYLNARTGPHADDAVLREYLRLRTTFDVPDRLFENIRFSASHTYWRDQPDEWGRAVSLYSGYAMIAPFVDLDGKVTGCHQTWIDLSSAPKYRPFIGLDARGEPFTTKKMKGVKKGSLIPICGDLQAERWLGGEGIETVVAVAGSEGFREDTLYFASGDLGNLAGPAARGCTQTHPTSTTTDKHGRVRKVTVPGPVAKPDDGDPEAVRVPDHVRALILLADGDSDFFFTANAMARAKARAQRDGRAIAVWWPPPGRDFASIYAERRG